jgi:hypothetical protein
MNSAILGTIIRWVGTLLAGTAIGVYLSAGGLLDPVVQADLIGKATAAFTSLAALFTVVWGIWQKIQAARKLNAAIVVPAAELPK